VKKMAGMNEHYHLSMKSELKKQLKEKADKEGISLAELIRRIFYNKLQEYNIQDSLKRIEEKLDKILKKI